ncbi:hypothetical protein J25TS5_38390 [Paenibacillus faecis]|nr:hypothetical protein J25TS5_38390 [Paenibacillus faecis]
MRLGWYISGQVNQAGQVSEARQVNKAGPFWARPKKSNGSHSSYFVQMGRFQILTDTVAAISEKPSHFDGKWGK